MATLNNIENCWPTQQQELLLRAVLLQGKDAIEAWEEWKSSVDIDQIDAGSYRLLPLLYRNLHIHEVKDSSMKKFKGIYRLTWYKNRILFYNIATLLRSFHNDGIQTMILKGAALTLLHYRDYGLRPMDDFDILVHTEQASDAFNLLRKLDWVSKTKLPETHIPFRHSTPFNDVAGRNIDLHWHVLYQCCQKSSDDGFWKNAVSTRVYDVSTYALDPTDQLFHACIHGATFNIIPPLRWVADAITIMNSSQSEIDWIRLITQAQKHYLILPLKDTLNYLKDILDAPVPLTVLQTIGNVSAPIVEHIENRYRIKKSSGILLGDLPTQLFHYLRLTINASLLQKLTGLPKYLQYIWGMEHLWQLPFCVVLKSRRRVWAKTVWYMNRLNRLDRKLTNYK